MCDVLAGTVVATADPGGGDDAAPPYGGQAVVEGVMMRGRDRWAVAVRRGDDGGITVERHAVPPAATTPLATRPLVRGLVALSTSLAIGTTALRISLRVAEAHPADPLAAHVRAADRTPDDEAVTVAGGALPALATFVLLFLWLPLATARALGLLVDGPDGVGVLAVEAGLRIGVLLAYVRVLALASDLQRVFANHGAEHQAIGGWERGSLLGPRELADQPIRHVRCGTNFLMLVVLAVGLLHLVVDGALGTPGLVTALLLRVLLLPLAAGLAYEAVRLGAARPDLVAVRLLMQPGLWLQHVTTRMPDDAQREVAVVALAAVVPVDDLVGRVAPGAITSPVDLVRDAGRPGSPVGGAA